MKSFIILMILVMNVTLGNTQQSNPPPEPDPGTACGHDPDDYFAIVSRLINHRGGGCDEMLVDDRSLGGVLRMRAEYENPTKSVYFKTNVNISKLVPELLPTSTKQSYLQFVEISSDKKSTNLPPIDDMLVQAVLVYSNVSKYQIQFNYKTSNKSDSITLDIPGDAEEFDLTLAWVNSGCIHTTNDCDNALGQLEVRVNYIKSSLDQVEIIEDLSFILPKVNFQNKTENPSYIPANTVYWGELDNHQFTGHLILITPN